MIVENVLGCWGFCLLGEKKEGMGVLGKGLDVSRGYVETVVGGYVGTVVDVSSLGILGRVILGVCGCGVGGLGKESGWEVIRW